MLRATLLSGVQKDNQLPFYFIIYYMEIPRGCPCHLTASNNLKSRIANNGLGISFNGQEKIFNRE